jgi:hypothetical protein
LTASETPRSKFLRHPSLRPVSVGAAALLAALALVVSIDVPAQASPEVQITAAPVWDFEFDSARNGKECPSCNYNTGNSRFAWIDNDRNLWLGWVDFQTGAFIPPDGRGQLLDVGGVPIAVYGNGPEWMSSSTWGSQIVYSRYVPGQEGKPGKGTIAVATTQPGGTWTTTVLPDSVGRATPVGTLDENDPDPRVNYIKYDKTGMYWRKMSEAAVEHEIPVSDMTDGNSRRWVPGTRKLIFHATPRSSAAGDPAPDARAKKKNPTQIFTYDTDTGELEQLTNDPEGYVGAFMWNAPEYDNELVFMTTPNGRESVKVFRNVPSSGGGMRWKVVKTVEAPAGAGLPYFWSPEPFVHNGRSYLVFQLSPTVSFFDKSSPTHVGISGIGRRDEVQVLTAGGPPRLRLDPEYFITAKGPLIYYKRSIPETPTSPAINDGVWYVDTKLGPPRR